MLPTPTKSHYTFNLRDVSKVFQGILQADVYSYRVPEQVTRLWVHEVCRCFHDRLVDHQDRSWFTRKVCKLLMQNFAVRAAGQSSTFTHQDLFEGHPLVFGNWVGGSGYNEFDAKKGRSLERICIGKVDEFNDEPSRSKMDLVFFKDAICHLSRVARIMQLPRGNALLVGLGGSGRQSLTRLAAYIVEYYCYEIELSRGFDYSAFQEHIRQMMKIAAVEGRPVAFLFTENQILEERFLEDVNNILNSGEVPNLWNADELSNLADEMMDVLENKKLPKTKAQAWATFVQLVQENLHIVLTMSPVGDAFRTRCRKFPSLINCTQIDWYNRWPEEALRSVAERFLGDANLDEKLRHSLANASVQVHSSMIKTCEDFYLNMRRRVYTTPKSFLDMIRMYMHLLSERRKEVHESRDRLIVGLGKLEETNQKVAELSEIMVKMKPELAKAAREAAELLKKVKKEKAAAGVIENKVSLESKKVALQQEQVNELKDKADKELQRALPELKEAVKAIDEIKKPDIAVVRALANPPEAVQVVMEAVCVLLKFPGKLSWETSKKMMSAVNFLHQLLTYEYKQVNDRMVKKLDKYLNHPDFTPEIMETKSHAAGGLCKWVIALVKFSKVNKKVEPLQAKVKELEAKLEAANEKLHLKQNELCAAQSKVSVLDKKCIDMMERKERLDNKERQTQTRLNNAEKLTKLLSNEQIRWTADSVKYGELLKSLTGDIFLAAACISYYGPFTGVWRNRCVKGWTENMRKLEIPLSDDFSLRKVLGKPTVIRQWNIDGLPTDAVSIDSAVVVSRAERWPLMIDPQSQANHWIKKMYKDKGLEITTFRNPKMLNCVINAVKNGFPVLIEDVDESVDASIDPILSKQMRTQGGGGYTIRLGDNEIHYDENFRMFMTTKQPNPHYLPEVCIKVTLLNFTVTQDGLEDQLLGLVVRKERADVEHQRQGLIVSMAKDQKEKKSLEVKILQMLSESDDNILDDTDLMETLESSKQTSQDINRRIDITKVTNKKIDNIREAYRDVATRGSLLYFVVSDMGMVDPMYQYSLEYFLNLFMRCLADSPIEKKVKNRVTSLIDYQTRLVYRNICRGLFEGHKLMFSFLIACAIRRNSGAIPAEEWNVLLRGIPISLDADGKKRMKENPIPEVLDSKGWAELLGIEKRIAAFRGISKIMTNQSVIWRQYCQSKNMHLSDPPCGWGKKLGPFQRLLLIRILAKEKLVFAFTDYVVQTM
eukprot:337727-Amorphochlora_amoeboformis.AAC.1